MPAGSLAAQGNCAAHSPVPAPRSPYRFLAQTSPAQPVDPVLYKVAPNRFLQLCVAVYGRGGVDGLERLRKLVQVNRARANWGTDLVALDEEMRAMLDGTEARAWISPNGLMQMVMGRHGSASVEEQRRVENLAKNTYGSRVQPVGLTGIWGAVAGISGEMTAQNPGRPVILLARQAVVCSSKNVCRLVTDTRGGKAFGMLVETGQTWEISLNSGEAAEVCCLETIPFPSIVVNNAAGRHLRVMDLRNGAVYPWGQWPVEATPTPKPTPTPEKPKTTSVEVVSDDFDGKKVVVTDQKRLDQARDYFFNKWFGKTTGWVDALLPRATADRKGGYDVPVKLNLSRGIEVDFLDIDQLTEQERAEYKQGIRLVNEVQSYYDVRSDGRLVIKVFLRPVYARNAAAILSDSMTRLRDIYIPMDSDIDLFRILAGEYPINKGGRAENFDFCLQLR